NYRTAELEYVLRQGDVTTLFTIEEHRGNSFVESMYCIAPELKSLSDPIREKLRSSNLPRLQRVILIGNEVKPGMMLYSDVARLGSELPDDRLIERESSLDPHDVIQIQYTSGTTGFPKGVMLTHYAMVNQTHVSCILCRLSQDDRYVTPMPFFHIAGSLGAILFPIYVGCTLIPLITFDPAKELELFHNEKATFSFNVPTMLIAMLNHPRFLAGEFDVSSLRENISGATPVPMVLMEEVLARMGADCTIVFGLTEATGTVTQTIQTDSFELKSSTVGIPHP